MKTLYSTFPKTALNDSKYKLNYLQKEFVKNFRWKKTNEKGKENKRRVILISTLEVKFKTIVKVRIKIKVKRY